MGKDPGRLQEALKGLYLDNFKRLNDTLMVSTPVHHDDISNAFGVNSLRAQLPKLMSSEDLLDEPSEEQDHIYNHILTILAQGVSTGEDQTLCVVGNNNRAKSQTFLALANVITAYTTEDTSDRDSTPHSIAPLLRLQEGSMTSGLESIDCTLANRSLRAVFVLRAFTELSPYVSNGTSSSCMGYQVVYEISVVHRTRLLQAVKFQPLALQSSYVNKTDHAGFPRLAIIPIVTLGIRNTALGDEKSGSEISISEEQEMSDFGYVPYSWERATSRKSQAQNESTHCGFKSLHRSMVYLGFSEEEQEDIYKTCLMIAALTDLSLTMEDDGSSSIRDRLALYKCASAFQCEVSVMETMLTRETVRERALSGRGKETDDDILYLTPFVDAIRRKQALAMSIYEGMIGRLFALINRGLSSKKNTASQATLRDDVGRKFTVRALCTPHNHTERVDKESMSGKDLLIALGMEATLHAQCLKSLDPTGEEKSWAKNQLELASRISDYMEAATQSAVCSKKQQSTWSLVTQADLDKYELAAGCALFSKSGSNKKQVGINSGDICAEELAMHVVREGIVGHYFGTPAKGHTTVKSSHKGDPLVYDLVRDGLYVVKEDEHSAFEIISQSVSSIMKSISSIQGKDVKAIVTGREAIQKTLESTHAGCLFVNVCTTKIPAMDGILYRSLNALVELCISKAHVLASVQDIADAPIRLALSTDLLAFDDNDEDMNDHDLDILAIRNRMRTMNLMGEMAPKAASTESEDTTDITTVLPHATTPEEGKTIENQDEQHEKGVKETYAEPQKDVYISKPRTWKRKIWVGLANTVTFFIPDIVLRKTTNLKTKDQFVAWREKVLLCFIAVLISSTLVFVVLGARLLVCDALKGTEVSLAEVYELSRSSNRVYIINGDVYDLTGWEHPGNVDVTDALDALNGMVISDLFQRYDPLSLTSSTSCIEFENAARAISTRTAGVYTLVNIAPAVPGTQLRGSDATSAFASLDATRRRRSSVLDPIEEEISGYSQGAGQVDREALCKLTSEDGQTSVTVESCHTDIDITAIDGFKVGSFVMAKTDLTLHRSIGDMYIAYEDVVYDISKYTTNERYFPALFNKRIVDRISSLSPTEDVSYQEQVVTQIFKEDPTLAAVKECLDVQFRVGSLLNETLNVACEGQSIALTILTFLVLGFTLFKSFVGLAALIPKAQEMQRKYVMCQVTCYSESEEELERTIFSTAELLYPDRKRVLVVICDGLVTGGGSLKPTSEIVLDILGYKNDNPEERTQVPSYAYDAVSADPAMRYNRAKVVSGVFRRGQRTMPYLVIIKSGYRWETFKAGNRGKRDSQVILIRYMNRLLYNRPMAPLEYEIYRALRHELRINPYSFDYLLAVDADTELGETALNGLVAICESKPGTIGVAGETRVRNPNDSWVTAIQVFEYFYSQNVSKAFESFFGKVTCLPGCYSMYRIKRPGEPGEEVNHRGEVPIYCDDRILREYSVYDVNTLHDKNLFSLGEDRYLTTLLLWYFPKSTLRFTGEPYCHTVVPDSFPVLLSQRRRWINSTLHNLSVLMFCPHLCGYGPLGMKTVVFVDLMSAFTLPFSLLFGLYLFLDSIIAGGTVPWMALIFIGGVTGVVMLTALLKSRSFDVLKWMMFNMIATPIFYFVLPLYALWHMDDFSWGATRTISDKAKSSKTYTRKESGDIVLRTLVEWDAKFTEAASQQVEATNASTVDFVNMLKVDYN